ncbi:MAG: hypothetical protein R6V56_03830 [Lentisphaeria bacterium]
MQENLIDIIVFLVFVGIALIRLIKVGLDKLSPQAEQQQKPRGFQTIGSPSPAPVGSTGAGSRPTSAGLQGPPPPPQPASFYTKPSAPSKTGITDYSAPVESSRYAARGEADIASESTAQLTERQQLAQPQNAHAPKTPPKRSSGGRAFSGEVPRFTTFSKNKVRPDILVALHNRRKLRLALLTREIIDRPRAFDV